MPDSTCSVPDCIGVTGIKGTARGYCSMHYNRWRRNGDPLIQTQRPITESCSVDGCQKPHDARGYCTAHITNLRRHGTPTPRQKGRPLNGMKICADCQQDRPVSDFYPAGPSLQARCKSCASLRAKAYRQSRIEIVREQARLSASRRPLQRRDAARKRRALRQAARVEDVNSQEVFERGAWACGICAEPIPRVVLWPHPLSPSLDHIVPLSLGGAHSYENTQPAHLACNMSKGARAA